MSRKCERGVVVLILLLAAALRLWALGEVPPGLAHDEVANWLIAQDILAGQHAIYFTAAYGHEPLYHYVQAASVAVLGDHWLGLRWPSFAVGLLGVAVTYTLTRRFFGASVAVLAMAWLAVSFWPLFYARVALRAITLPLIAALSVYFLFRALGLPTSRSTHSRTTDWLLAGFFAGLSLYTYMAARILPFILAGLLVYLILIRSCAPIPWSRLLAFLTVAAGVSAPLVAWLVVHPGVEYRVAEVQEPLIRLLAGDAALVWQNLVANLKFFTVAGDPWPRQNLPGRPVFADPISVVLFCAGLVIALRRWRDFRYGFLLVWLAGALVPSIVTSDAPSSIRDILGLVVVFVFPALALVEVVRWVERRRQGRGFLSLGSCLLLLVPCLLLTVRDYFVRWPQHDEVRFDYQADLTAVARWLDRLPVETPVAVAGLSVHTMDGPGLELASRRDVREVRLCDTRETLVVPVGPDGWLFVPRVVPFDADLQARLLVGGAVMDGDSPLSFVSYRLRDAAAWFRVLQGLETAAALPGGASVALPASFDGRLAFLGYEWLSQGAAPGDSLSLLTYWQVEEPIPGPLKIFVHLVGEADAPVAQHDGLGSPSRGWATGDLIIQKHVLALPADLPTGLYKLYLGVYNAPVGPRLSVANADRLLLSPVEVGAPSTGRSYSIAPAYSAALEQGPGGGHVRRGDDGAPGRLR